MIPIIEPSFGTEELDNLTQTIKSGWISSKGDFIPRFEDNFSAYCGTKYGVAVSNGTVALHLALKALGIDKDDEVIVPTFTFIATANAVAYCNAKPVFVDSHPDYWCIDPDKIEEKITSKTKAIIPVHLYGHPCDMDAIMDIAGRYNLYVVEDAAEAHGAEYKGKKVGSFGNINCFSFYGNKIITTGEGGMCLTDNEVLAGRMRVLRDHGMSHDRKYWHDEVGYNYRMTNMQAAVGVAQLTKIDNFIVQKRRIAASYMRCFKNLEEQGYIKLHPQMPWAKCVYWIYSILIEDDFPLDRDELMEKLMQKGVDTRPLFYPVHQMPTYNKGEKFPVSEGLSHKGISLPSSVALSDADINTIDSVIQACSC